MRIIIEGIPIAKKRFRYTSRGSYIHTYDVQIKEKESIQTQMIQMLKKHSQDQPIRTFAITEANYLKVRFVFCLSPSVSEPTSEKNEKLWGFQLPGQKPDIDNLEKFYLDCANGILWKDDKQIIEIYSKKIYGQIPYVQIDIEEKKGLIMEKNASEILKCFSPQELESFLKDAYNIGVFYKEEIFYSEDIEGKKDFLKNLAHKLSVFIANHDSKIMKVRKKIWNQTNI